MKYNAVFGFIFLLFSFSSNALVKLSDLSIENKKNVGPQLEIKLDKSYREIPDLTVEKRMIQIALPDVSVWPKINKVIQLKGIKANLEAYQYNKQLARVRLTLPYSLSGNEKNVSILLKDKSLLVSFPLLAAASPRLGTSNQQVAQKRIQKEKENKTKNYDENYLKHLLNEVEKQPGEVKEVAPIATAKKALSETKTTKPAVLSKPSSKIDFTSYVGKFVGVLIIVLGIFFLLVHLFKKGVLKRGNFQFLSDTKTIQVLNTTYVAPKRSLQLIKVNEQVFLVGNSESGFQFISEINNPNEVMKQGELQLSGQNFDTNLGKSNDNKTIESKVKLKETIESNEFTQKRKDKFTDSLKKKVKELRPLQ